MIYKDNDIPEGYNKLAEISDNYLVWVRESTLQSGTKYNAYIQYISPSPWLLFTDNYLISTGTDYTLDANYISNGMYNYLDSYDVSFTRSTISVDSEDIATGVYDRGDAPMIFVCQFICVISFLWILNQLTKICHKGGILH